LRLEGDVSGAANPYDSTFKVLTTGVGVLEDMLLESGLVGMSDNSLRPTRAESKDEPKTVSSEQPSIEKGLRQIPVPVSASAVWYIQVAENPEDGEIDKFIEMQKLIFGKK
jgi:hypothetical protein